MSRSATRDVRMAHNGECGDDHELLAYLRGGRSVDHEHRAGFRVYVLARVTCGFLAQHMVLV